MPDDKNPLLEESQTAERAGKFLIMGCRREGGQMAPVSFRNDRGAADTYAAALIDTGWCTVEIYTRASVLHRK